MSYDEWKLADGDDPGRGRLYPMRLTCRDCPWGIKGRAIVVVSSAIRHAEETGHAIRYKGVVQQFSGRSA